MKLEKKKKLTPRNKNKTNPNHSNLSPDRTIASKLTSPEQMYLFEIPFIFCTKLPEHITIKWGFNSK